MTCCTVALLSVSLAQVMPMCLATILNLAVVLLLPRAGPTSATRFSKYILAPHSRSVTPPSLIGVTGRVMHPDTLCTNAHNSQGVVFAANSSITLDFGKNIAGTVEFDVRSVSGENEYVGFTFTESSLWISPYQCDSGTSAMFDSPLWFTIPAKGKYAAEKKRQRGGFRYMSI
jgi:hypothetical protein